MQVEGSDNQFAPIPLTAVAVDRAKPYDWESAFDEQLDRWVKRPQGPRTGAAVPDHTGSPLAELQRKLKADPHDWYTNVQLARKYRESGDLSRGVEMYVEADEISTGDAAFQMEAAEAAYRAGYFGRLSNFVYQALEIDPKLSIPKHLRLAVDGFGDIFNQNGTPEASRVAALKAACKKAEGS